VAGGALRGVLRRDRRLALGVLIMKTVTVTEAKKHLGAYLKEAIEGANVGIVCGAQIVALRPVEITSIDVEEVGDPDLTQLTAEQRDRVYAQLKKERKVAKRRRKELLAGAAARKG
jgi:antitoxin (DNA-binding transcriptional repressor) of toxin-antitoxin stability system